MMLPHVFFLHIPVLLSAPAMQSSSCHLTTPMETRLQFSSPINAARPCMASLTLLLMGPGTWHGRYWGSSVYIYIITYAYMYVYVYVNVNVYVNEIYIYMYVQLNRIENTIMNNNHIYIYTYVNIYIYIYIYNICMYVLKFQNLFESPPLRASN